MSTVIDLTELSPRVVSDPAEIQRLRRFQTDRYVESGLLANSPTELPADHWVEHSTYFGLYGGSEIQATARIVRAVDGELPLLEHHEIVPAYAKILRDNAGSIAEISRLAVGASTPRHRALALLARSFLHFSMEHQHASLLVGSVGHPLARILNRMLGVPLRVIGPEIATFGDFDGAGVPILIDPLECLSHFSRGISRRSGFFMEGLTIDLTGEFDSPTVTMASAAS